MKLFIKNMVCTRCKMAVNAELISLGLHPVYVESGEVKIAENDIKGIKPELISKLRSLGFDLLDDAKSKTVEKHFRGFDNTMVETGYRYQELYWAGQDQNREYADYQLSKIKLALEDGMERRPKRAKSANYFIKDVLPDMKKTITKKDTSAFNKAFVIFTKQCNSCHAKENVSFFHVQAPTVRQSSIKK